MTGPRLKIMAYRRIYESVKLLSKLLLAFLLASHMRVPLVQGQVADEEVRINLVEAYEAVAEAEEAGGEVSGLLERLNDALGLMEQGRFGEADIIVAEVLSRAPLVESTGAQGERYRLAVGVGTAVALVSLAAVSWLFGSRFIWRVWLRSRRGWVVRRFD